MSNGWIDGFWAFFLSCAGGLMIVTAVKVCQDILWSAKHWSDEEEPRDAE